jgi:hypothetical protein
VCGSVSKWTLLQPSHLSPFSSLTLLFVTDWFSWFLGMGLLLPLTTFLSTSLNCPEAPRYVLSWAHLSSISNKAWPWMCSFLSYGGFVLKSADFWVLLFKTELEWQFFLLQPFLQVHSYMSICVHMCLCLCICPTCKYSLPLDGWRQLSW